MKAFFNIHLLIILINYTVTANPLILHLDTLDNREHVKTKKGISLYEKWFEKPNYGKIREVTLEFTINAPVEKVVDYIKQGNRIKDWNKNVKECESFQKNQNEWFTYIRYGIPWPFDDQDCLLINSYKKESNDYISIYFESAENNRKPVNDGIERMEDVKGKWELIAKEQNQTFVRYSISSKPSKVPVWITDPFVRKAFIDSMSEFSQLVENE
jgi:hypothetical protein